MKIIKDAHHLVGTWKDKDGNELLIHDFGKKMTWLGKDGSLDGQQAPANTPHVPETFYSSPMGFIAVYEKSSNEIVIKKLLAHRLTVYDQIEFTKADQ